MFDKKGMVVKGFFVVMILGLLVMSLGVVVATPEEDLAIAQNAFDYGAIDQAGLDEAEAEYNRLVGDGSGEPKVSYGATGGSGDVGGWFKEKYDLWLTGVNWSAANTEEQVDSVGQIIKWFILILIVLLIYSGLSAADFPDNQPIIRFILAVATGFLGTFLITTRELLTALQSYTAMGIALTVFFPIFILGFFSVVVIKRAKPFGIFLQTVLWIIYSVYLFIRTGIYLWLKNAAANGSLTVGEPYSILGFVNIEIDVGVMNAINAYSGSMLMILFITSIAVFIIMVIGNRYVRKRIDEGLRDAEVDAYASTLKRDKEATKLSASRLSDQG